MHTACEVDGRSRPLTMRRLFGKAKDSPPPATLDDAVNSVCAHCACACVAPACLLGTHPRRTPPCLVARQLDKRGGAIDDKIKKLDEELMKHKELIARARPGPAQARALAVGACGRRAPSRATHVPCPLPRVTRSRRRPSRGLCGC